MQSEHNLVGDTVLFASILQLFRNDGGTTKTYTNVGVSLARLGSHGHEYRIPVWSPVPNVNVWSNLVVRNKSGWGTHALQKFFWRARRFVQSFPQLIDTKTCRSNDRPPTQNKYVCAACIHHEGAVRCVCVSGCDIPMLVSPPLGMRDARAVTFTDKRSFRVLTRRISLAFAL